MKRFITKETNEFIGKLIRINYWYYKLGTDYSIGEIDSDYVDRWSDRLCDLVCKISFQFKDQLINK